MGQFNPTHNKHKMPRALLAGRIACKAKRCNSEQTKPSQRNNNKKLENANRLFIPSKMLSHLRTVSHCATDRNTDSTTLVSTPSVTVPQTVKHQISSYKQKFFTIKNDNSPTAHVHQTFSEFSARQRVTLFCSEQTRNKSCAFGSLTCHSKPALFKL